MIECRKCGAGFEQKPWQIRKKDTLCSVCTRIQQQEYRDKRKATGNPVVSTKAPAEYHRRYAVVYYHRPDVITVKRVRAKTANAIKSGKLVRKPCEQCGNTATEAHHDDYSKPLDIRWLCRKHHREFHVTERRKSKGLYATAESGAS